jgi:capsular exopolysaccharide synthesis family protein
MAVMAASALLLGTFILLFREQINNTFSDPNDLTKATGLPILAAVPLNGRSKSAKRLVARFLSQPRSVLSESIRGLRTSILYSDPVNQPKVVMFTSSQPGEGKSALSMLIGLASQQTRRRAILVNCDLRNHRNARFYNKMPRLLTSEETPDTPARPGLVAYYNKSCTLNEALSHEPKSGLNFLALGPRESLSESPADVFSSRRFAEILETLRESYDLVILDTPPALAVTDSRLLARLSDSIVYVVRWNKTKRNAVKEGLKEISMMKINVAGCVFSMVSQRKARKYSDNEYIYKQAYSGYYN